MRSKKKVYLSFNTWVKNLSALINFVKNSADIQDKLPTAMKQGVKQGHRDLILILQIQS